MSTSGPRYHIPFPRAFLSLNTPGHKTVTASNVTNDATDVVTETVVPQHNFLSNRPHVGRHPSISSVSSLGSAGSPPSSPPTKASDSPVLEQKVPTFLALNSKFTPPPPAPKKMSVSDKPGFLSNMH